MRAVLALDEDLVADFAAGLAADLPVVDFVVVFAADLPVVDFAVVFAAPAFLVSVFFAIDFFAVVLPDAVLFAFDLPDVGFFVELLLAADCFAFPSSVAFSSSVFGFLL